MATSSRIDTAQSEPTKRAERVLVLDGAQRAALAVTRALGRRGIPVVVGDAEDRTISGASRYCSARLVHASPALAPDRFVTDIVAAVARHNITSIYPITDVSTMLLVGKADLLAPAKLCAPGAAAYEAVTNKANLVTLAQRLGVPVPASLVAQHPDEIIEAAQRLSFPVVLKPAYSRFVNAERRIEHTSVKVAASPAALHALVKTLPWIGAIPCLLQEFIPGYGAGVFTLYGREGALTWFAHRRIREMPPSGGVSVLCESAAVDPAMQRYAQRLLDAAGWFGPAMVEYRIADDGSPYLMEINGRFWGSLQLPIDCGVDFPALLLAASRNEPVMLQAAYPHGKRLRWFLRDIDNLAVRLRDSSKTASYKIRAILDFLATGLHPRTRQELLRWDDMRPAARELVMWLQSMSFFRRGPRASGSP